MLLFIDTNAQLNQTRPSTTQQSDRPTRQGMRALSTRNRLPRQPPTHTMAHVTKTIRGYATDTREYAGNTRTDIRAYSGIFGHIRAYASSRGYIKDYQSSHGYAQIRGLDIRQYADIRGHSHRFTVTYPRMPLVTSALCVALLWRTTGV